MKEDLAKAIKARNGYLKGIDGRLLYVRSEHSALNVICQSAGALVMKKALVLLDKKLQGELGLIPGVDYEFVLNCHDEYQLEVLDKNTETGEWLPKVVGEKARQAIILAGEHFKVRCSLDGEYKIGLNWKETH